jgi:hypothetical protein
MRNLTLLNLLMVLTFASLSNGLIAQIDPCVNGVSTNPLRSRAPLN